MLGAGAVSAVGFIVTIVSALAAAEQTILTRTSAIPIATPFFMIRTSRNLCFRFIAGARKGDVKNFAACYN
jgi:hypothetical protein